LITIEKLKIKTQHNRTEQNYSNRKIIETEPQWIPLTLKHMAAHFLGLVHGTLVWLADCPVNLKFSLVSFGFRTEFIHYYLLSTCFFWNADRTTWVIYLPSPPLPRLCMGFMLLKLQFSVQCLEDHSLSFSLVHWVVCPLIDGFWLPIWYS
jgi:hypothetical protein